MSLSVSIITVTYNSKHYLEKFLPAIFLTQGDFEIIIFDNHSSDGTVDYISKNFPQVKLIQNQENLGFAMGNNLAAAQSTADILTFINPDTIVEPEWLDHILKPFSDNQVGLTTSKILLMKDPHIINACGNSMHVSGITQCRGVDQPASHYAKQEEIAAVSGAAFAIRKTLFDSLNGFDTDYFLYMEETDLSVRARLLGYKCIYVPHSIIYHDYELRFGAKKVFYQEKNRYLLILKSLKIPTIILSLPIFLIAEIITWGFVILKDRQNFMNKIDAYAWIIRNRRSISQKRKIIQASRIRSDHDLISVTMYQINFDQVSNGALNDLLRIFNVIFFVLKQVLLFILRIFKL
jgi:GT2 family glycosyltransferase